MKQQDLGLNLSKRRTRKAVFLDAMNLVVPWSELLALIVPHAPRAKTGRPPFELETMLRIHFAQQWFGLSDLAMEEALFGTLPPVNINPTLATRFDHENRHSSNFTEVSCIDNCCLTQIQSFAYLEQSTH